MILAVTVTAGVVGAMFEWSAAEISVFPAEIEGRQTKIICYNWNKWPAGVPWQIEKSTDLVNWTIATPPSDGNDSNKIGMMEPTGPQVFFRIKRP